MLNTLDSTSIKKLFIRIKQDEYGLIIYIYAQWCIPYPVLDHQWLPLLPAAHRYLLVSHVEVQYIFPLLWQI